MKYAIIIPDGCADEPQASLGGKTPLQAAHKPNMDRIAQLGVVGRSDNVPPTLTPASDVATLSLFGSDRPRPQPPPRPSRPWRWGFCGSPPQGPCAATP